MADLVKALAGTEKGLTDLVAAALIVLGVLLMIGGCVYRVFVRPEWTFDEALHALWPFFLAGGVSLMLGWLVDRAETSSPGRQ
jgi:predicted membrane channel-forming protein YqfA (hemolysin III family)